VKRKLGASALFVTLALASPSSAQTREPLCVTTEVRRLVGAPWMQVNGRDWIVAKPLPAPASDGAVFVVAARDPDRSLRVGEARTLARSIDEMEFRGSWHPPERDPGLTVMRVGRDLRVVGEPVFLQDPVRGERGEETFPPGIPAGVTVDAGVLVIEHVAGDLYATVIPPTGAAPAVQRVAEAPSASSTGHRGFVWLTAMEHTVDNARGAIALAGTDDGEVTALRFDGRGQRIGNPVIWNQRVGGEMHLLPVPAGSPPSAILERPVRGTTLTGEQAREQVLVRLRPTIEPDGEPERLGLGPYVTAATVRGDQVVLTQWAESRGLAVSPLTPREGRFQFETPRIWTTQPLEGVPIGHSSIRGAGNIVYDLMLHGDDVAGGLHAYLTYIPPSGTPVSRRDVIPLRARVIAPPALVPAEDGLVAVMATYDELGGGIDAAHIRCEMVTLPAR
jgi:hypothetical protein